MSVMVRPARSGDGAAISRAWLPPKTRRRRRKILASLTAAITPAAIIPRPLPARPRSPRPRHGERQPAARNSHEGQATQP
jgi:hypothetical protein